MTFTTTLVFYTLVGLGIAAAVALYRSKGNTYERLFQVVCAVAFWPMFIPLLLRTDGLVEQRSKLTVPQEPSDELAVSIQQVESELDAALMSLDGWAENVLSHEQDRFAELKSTWRQQADRIRELDQLLARPEFTKASNQSLSKRNLAEPERDGAFGDSVEAANRAASSEAARGQNIARLADVRRKLANDLMGTLAWVRELVTMIHLAKFTGAPASRAEELVSQIAAAVEGMSEVTGWRNEDSAGENSARTIQTGSQVVSPVSLTEARMQRAALRTREPF